MSPSTAFKAIAPSASEIAWWVMHHSLHADRMAAMITVYLDESTINPGTNSPVAVVAGLLFRQQDFFWIETPWKKAAFKHLSQYSIHMKDFGLHGKLNWVSSKTKEALFRDLVKVIRDHKFLSIESTLTHAEYRSAFGGVDKRYQFSIHGLCFMQAMMAIGKWADHFGCTYDIPYMLDDGCADRKALDEIHDFAKNVFQVEHGVMHVGPLAWGDDEEIPALQAADVIAWAVRRKEAGESFDEGYTPLLDVFQEGHLPQHFEAEWIGEIAQTIRDRVRANEVES
jgi:hypothetical protein